jgi:hypothetical protein
MIGSLENGAPLRGGTKAYPDFRGSNLSWCDKITSSDKKSPRNDDPSIPISSPPYLRDIDMLILHQVYLR